MARQISRVKSHKPGADVPRCGLCGKTKNLVQTECCGNWICNDEDKYVVFSYARNSCHRNHNRYTLCANHYNEDHEGDWKTCKKCRAGFETEMYVWYGTNEYNFEKLENPPSFKPTHCVRCGAVIKLGYDGYTQSREGYSCESCSSDELQRLQSMQASIPRGKRKGAGGGAARGAQREGTEDMNFEEEYADVLRELETAIIGVHKQQPSLVDLEVVDALEGLVRTWIGGLRIFRGTNAGGVPKSFCEIVNAAFLVFGDFPRSSMSLALRSSVDLIPIRKGTYAVRNREVVSPPEPQMQCPAWTEDVADDILVGGEA